SNASYLYSIWWRCILQRSRLCHTSFRFGIGSELPAEERIYECRFTCFRYWFTIELPGPDGSRYIYRGLRHGKLFGNDGWQRCHISRHLTKPVYSFNNGNRIYL